MTGKEIDCRATLAMTGKETDCRAALAMTGKEIDCRATLAMTDDQSLRGMKQSTKYLLEPVGRNTAPAIALACMACGSDEIILVTPSDHLVKNEAEYEKVLAKAKELAEQDNLVTFGIKPAFAETGFGYIQATPDNVELGILNVELFKEKPHLEQAEQYIEENLKLRIQNLPLKYYWNSGMFCFKAGVFLTELQKYSPEIFDACKIALQNADMDGMIRIKHEDMLNIPDDSIDYAVMEKSARVKVVPSDIGWSDVGSFDALYDELEKDENGNTQNEHLIAIDSKNNLIIGSERVIATVDVNDLIIVDSGDALLISKKGSSQKVKQVVQELKKQGSNLPNIHQTAHRPWGTYTILEDTPGYKIKRIEVKPGKRLSLQKHFHRNEHWIVVSGTATVTVGEEVKLIRPNESTYIKMGEVHRLANEGKIPVILIEAQVGEYTGEDDIVRVEDDFKRS
ncbi:mannose-1-phosphate guanylyltransferase/mannose-6-phosphate isomerase [Sulfurovum sp.]|uniref:mannose-1-phosphate guanylyltransferase/mannose-6-phosphate isomerase n=1 Tax=Sulfurovum sp. TaxID=1969726 RepID=UPI002867FC0C|nr:mannose-1-phosphate guanylyltransferase/mannose-6-phosphate isomerase [Sulfurovum sp.]